MTRRICVFCGSSDGVDPERRKSAAKLGAALAARNIALVYGGGGIGLMGAVADGALAAGGEVIGVIPSALLKREVGHRGLTELHETASMHKRKALMAELSDAFLALPGGIGTLEELFEIWTWAQLGVHAKPIGVHNHNGFYTPLLEFMDKVGAEGFLRAEHRALVMVEAEIEPLLDRLVAARPAPSAPWLDGDQT